MGYLEHQINEMKSFLESEKHRCEQALVNVPQGSLQRAINGGKPKYYQSVSRSDGSGKYSRRLLNNHPEIIRQLADKEYAMKAIELIDKDEELLRYLELHMVEINPEAIISMLKPAYKTLPPGTFSLGSREIVKDSKWKMQAEWAMQDYEQSKYKAGERCIQTSSGLYVRSKSELVVAERLNNYGVPFRYEQVILVGGSELAPDFSFLDRLKKEFYLEYCGMMDNPEYVKGFMTKRNLYERFGINQWDDMIYLFERGNRINIREIDWIIENRIIPRL